MSNYSFQVLGEAEEKLIKAAQEVNQLRVEESTLRQENLQLRVNINYIKSTITCLNIDFLHPNFVSLYKTNPSHFRFNS